MYTPLYIKTDNSLQTSIIKVKDLIEFASKNNIKSLSITDNNMYGVMDFYILCVNNNIKPIIGLEIEYDNKKIVLYAKNYIGYKNLIKLSTISSQDKIDLNVLKKYSSNLICILNCKYIDIYDDLNDYYEDIFISYDDKKELKNLNNYKTIYMKETLYLYKNDSEYIKYMDAIREGVTINLIEENHKDNYLLLEEEFNNIYSESIENNHLIYDLCNIEIPFKQDLMPKYTNELNIDSFSYLKKMCIEGLKKHFGDRISVIYKTRLKYELDIINKMGFCDYFLIVSDYVKYAKNNNIIVGTGRGSAVGSLVAYCLSITDVDPIKYNLLFERFLNPERISMPDIDIDFEADKRDEVIKYCISKYGEKRVVPIITFGTLGCKQALRDVASTLNIEIGLVDKLCKLIDSKKSLKENLENDLVKTLLSRKSELKKCYKIALKFEGLKRHTSLHAAGVVMSSVDLDEVIPLDKSHEFYSSGFDMTYLEDLGLLKMDFLAINYLTTIHNIIDSINKEYNTNLSFDTIPLNDEDTLNIFNKVDTIGIFQFESSGMMNFLSKLKVSSMDDLFAAIALFRPGPMNNIPHYIDRKLGREKVDYIDSSLENILKSTYGIIIYQEQIMLIAQVMANYSLGEADILRKAMGKKKKELVLKEKEKFTSRALNKGYKIDIINKVYEMMVKFAEYGFNKSHSVAYSIIAYKMAYLKAHYPKNFITYLLSMEVGDSLKTKRYIFEAKKNGINILAPDINKSYKKYIIEDNGIRYPLLNIKNVGSIASEIILNERQKGEYTDIYDFICRCYGKSINKKTIESLIYSGAFSLFNMNKKTLINNLDLIINYGELIKDLDREYAIEPEIKIYDEYSNSELANFELDTFGFYLTNNPIIDFKLKHNNIISLNKIESYFDKNINVIVNVDKVKEINTKNESKMAFINASDELDNIDIVLFTKVYEKYKVEKNNIIKVNGKVEKRYDKYQLVANTITILQ